MTYLYETREAETVDNPVELTAITPELIQAALEVYRNYYQTHGNEAMAPLGVVVDQRNLRGQLIFTGKPILLPYDCFIPSEQLIEPDADYGEYWE
ncbi:hypothetical protein [Lyngbya confervoides]|uniref:Uncharacterized protein n=1 Tax=Lyngbya confervoides BDU141951 TaxID=1574623 RepID=A0ABD4T3P9_9CYAN|nr:hypothetical protein [Lyngbya confervoides]MCM1983083.1 hypothetical protein [Lyngbya confervoides BDU141951]